MSYGIVFKDQLLYIGMFNSSLEITDFTELEDFNDDYELLSESDLAFVEIREDTGEFFELKDIGTVTVTADQYVITVAEFLHESEFPSERSNEIFSGVYRDFIPASKLN